MLWLALTGLTLAGMQAPLSFPTSTELVRVVVNVTDSAGRPVLGLRPDQFSVSMPFRSHADFGPYGAVVSTNIMARQFSTP